MKLSHPRTTALLWLTLAGQAVAAAPPGRYALDDAGTSSVDDDQVTDTRTGLTWQRGNDGRSYTWGEAQTYCAELKLAAQGGFRLPSRRELLSLVDYTATAPAIDRDAFPRTPNDPFWTSTPYAGSAGSSWSVDFMEGVSSATATSVPQRVRCVRTRP